MKFIIIILLLLFINIIYANNELLDDKKITDVKIHPKLLNCNRFKSKLARNRIDQIIKPQLEYYSYDMPISCAFHSDRDMTLPFENNKKRFRKRKWQCKLCEKLFRSEDWLDKHFNRRHSNIIDEIQDPICSADLCNILRCEQTKIHKKCDVNEMHHYEIQCNEIMHQCFPPSQSSTTNKLYNYFIEKVCNELICEQHDDGTLRHRIVEDINSGSSVLFYVVLGIVIALLLIFYASMYMYHYDVVKSRDLKRLKAPSLTEKLKFWKSHEKKKLF